MKMLPKKFFDRPTVEVARDLIGMYIVRNFGDRIERYMITETEAYDGPQDLASHAARGRRTKRSEVLFGEAGTIYIYFTYGMHWLLNIVTGPKDYPAAVLIRGVKDISGPARLTKKLKLDGALHGKSVSRQNGLWIEVGEQVDPKMIERTPRIGVDYAGRFWAGKKYRFLLKENKRTILPTTSSPAPTASTGRTSSATAARRGGKRG